MPWLVNGLEQVTHAHKDAAACPQPTHRPSATHTSLYTWKKSKEAAETKRTHSTRQKKAQDFQSIF